MLFSNKNQNGLNVAIIGATGGIGRALINELLSCTAIKTIYCCARSNLDMVELSGLKSESASSKLTYFCIDLCDESSIRSAANSISQEKAPLDIVIVATGLLHDKTSINPEKSLRQLTSENFITSMTINALGPALVAKHFLPLMNKKNPTFFGALSARVGSISDNGLGGWHSYRSSKAALNMLIKNIAIEYKRKLPQLIVAGLHPGTVNTRLSEPFQRSVTPEKLFSSRVSAQHILEVIEGLNEDDSGYCFAWDGKKIEA